MNKSKVKIKNNRPFYSPFLGCYVVDYSVDGQKSFKTFDDHKQGIEWIKSTFPIWFAKHYSIAKTNK